MRPKAKNSIFILQNKTKLPMGIVVRSSTPKASFQKLRFRIFPYVERMFFYTSYDADGLIRTQAQ